VKLRYRQGCGVLQLQKANEIILFFNSILFAIYTSIFGARGSLVVKALGYKPEGRGFETR
jgi:hypothetical protein